MAAYSETHYDVNGIDTAVLTAGEGAPLVFLHGAGTALGFDSMLPLAERARLIVPNHPGLRRLGRRPAHRPHPGLRPALPRPVRPARPRGGRTGRALAGRLHRVARSRSSSRSGCVGSRWPRRSGSGSREHPTVDFFSIPDEEVRADAHRRPVDLRRDRAAADAGVPRRAAIASRPRSRGSRGSGRTTRSSREWLHRVTMPTLIVWGEADRLIPVEQAAIWAGAIPNASR